MKSLVKISSLLMILTGLILTPWVLGENDMAVWVHLLLGFGYTVLFLLFGYDHISGHQTMLTQATTKNLTGWTQAASGGLALLSGFVLYLYGSTPLPGWTEVHLGATLVFGTSLALHIFGRIRP